MKEGVKEGVKEGEKGNVKEVRKWLLAECLLRYERAWKRSPISVLV